RDDLGRTALHLERLLDSRGDRRRILEQRMNPWHAPRAARPCAGENFEASGCVRDDNIGPDRFGHQSRAECLAASRTRQMARIESSKRGLLAMQLGDVLCALL